MSILNKLEVSKIHPFVRRVGIAKGLIQENVKSYDYRMLLILSDGGEIDIDGNKITPKKSDAFLISPGVMFSVNLLETQKMLVVNFDWDMQYPLYKNYVLTSKAIDFEAAKIINKYDWSDVFSLEEWFFKKTNPTIIEMCHNLLDVFSMPHRSKENQTLLLSAIFMQIISELLEDKKENNKVAEQIYEYIFANYDKPITMDVLSKEFSYHKNYINRLLKKYYGSSFRQLIIRFRLKQAIFLLDETTFSIQEISDKLGFYDYKHFHQCFKNKYGVTPSKHRYKHKREISNDMSKN